MGYSIYFDIKLILFSMKKIIIWLSGFVSDNGQASSKRLVGVVCSFFLCGALYLNTFKGKEFSPSPVLVQSVAALAFGCLGLTSAEKIWKKENK